MIKILVNDGIHPDGKLLLEEANYQVDTDKIPQEQLAESLPDYDVIIVRSATKVRQDLIEKCPRLKVIARGGVGLDNIDVDYAKSKGIAVINTPAASSESVAELAFAHIFSLSRFLNLSHQQMAEKGDSEFKALKKSYSKGSQVRGRALGIVGFGRIGQEVARIGLALGMRILPVDLVVDKANIELNLAQADDIRLSVDVPTVDMDTMLKEADYISLHVPFTGKALIGKDEFSKMKNTAVIVNTARGGAIDEDALLEALDAGDIAGAGLDVFLNEPTPRKELLTHPKISTSPHIGASTMEAQRNIGLELADRIIAHFGDDK